MTNLLSKLKQAAAGTAGATATASSSTASGATSTYSARNPPHYVYKILPTHSNAVRYAFPVPVPASYVFPATELDAKDGFVHLSTHEQVPGTLRRFFQGQDDSRVTLVRFDYARLAGWKIVKWEPAGSTGQLYPHLYAQLEGELVDDHREIQRADVEQGYEAEKNKEDASGQGSSTAGWDAAVQKLQQEGWLQ